MAEALNMTQEEKKLLYKDLSARQSYRPFVCFAGKVTMPFLDVIASTESNELMSINGLSLEDVKPYLRPMSSMTEEESKEFAMLQTDFYSDGWLYPIAAVNMVDWLIAHHFDFRGLIPMGLALEAPADMYKTE
jgi:hypothetical protein